MIVKFFSFIGNIVSGVGLVIGSIIVFLVYALVGYFFHWLVSSFSSMMIDWEWITNEYVQYFILTVFEDYKHITEIVFALGFGLAGVLKVLRGDNTQE